MFFFDVLKARADAPVNDPLALLFRRDSAPPPPPPPAAEHYGMKILKGYQSNPDLKCIYLYDAVGFTPKSINSIGSWGNAFFVRNNYPVMCKADGTEDYRLDPADHSKKLDGTPSDVSNPSYQGNAMSCFNCEIWMKFYEDSNYYYVEVADRQLDSDFVNYPYKRYDRTTQTTLPDAKKLYYPMFEGTLTSGTLRSLAGNRAASSTTASEELAAAYANGNHWSIGDWSHHMWMSVLMLLMGKDTNVQYTFGMGRCQAERSSPDETDFVVNGSLMTAGQFYGDNVDYTKPMKAFYCENLYGNRYKRTLGLYNVAGVYYGTMLPQQYTIDNDVTGYTNGGALPANSGIVRAFRFVNTAYGTLPLPSDSDASSTGASGDFCDKITVTEQNTNLLCVGGRVFGSTANYYNLRSSGPLCLMFTYRATSASWYLGASLSLQEPVSSS